MYYFAFIDSSANKNYREEITIKSKNINKQQSVSTMTENKVNIFKYDYNLIRFLVFSFIKIKSS